MNNPHIIFHIEPHKTEKGRSSFYLCTKSSEEKAKKVGEIRSSNGKLIDIDAEIGAVLGDGLGEHEGAILGFFFIFIHVAGAEVDARAAFQGSEEG